MSVLHCSIPRWTTAARHQLFLSHSKMILDAPYLPYPSSPPPTPSPISLHFPYEIPKLAFYKLSVIAFSSSSPLFFYALANPLPCFQIVCPISFLMFPFFMILFFRLPAFFCFPSGPRKVSLWRPTTFFFLFLLLLCSDQFTSHQSKRRTSPNAGKGSYQKLVVPL